LDVNKDKVTALVFAHFMWILAAALPYFSNPGTVLFSFSALALIFGGVLVAGPLFGLGFHGLRSSIGRSLTAPTDGPAAPGAQTLAMVGVLLTLLEVIVILVAADWTFRRVETARAGYPIEYAIDRTSFNAVIATFANANHLAEEAKLARETGKTDAEKETQLFALIEDGLEFGRTVSDPFLAYLDPELPERYRTQLVRGFEMMLEGHRTSDPEKETAGNALVRQFYTEYMPSRVNTILRRMGSEAAPP
jgi:hypothetical protein